tara:strand:+ start:740 stop:1159 length:420 start_codon:yes stop_codon:yes gene_type:complete
MQEFFWFFLGGFVYLILDRIGTFNKKVKFLNEVKLLSFMLIGYAYQQWITVTAAKYIYFYANEHDEEHIKIMKNTDEAEMLEWKKEAVACLNESVPPYYRSALKIDGWKTIIDSLEAHYRTVLEADYVIKGEADPDVEN